MTPMEKVYHRMVRAFRGDLEANHAALRTFGEHWRHGETRDGKAHSARLAEGDVKCRIPFWHLHFDQFRQRFSVCAALYAAFPRR
jgi:hypothetical protein